MLWIQQAVYIIVTLIIPKLFLLLFTVTTEGQ